MLLHTLEAGGLRLEILYFEKLPSTQLYAKELLKTKNPPFTIVAKHQSSGVGSRGNSWDGVERGLYMSVASLKSDFPEDMPLQSTSLYVGANIVEFLRAKESKIWMKWPNDLYLGDEKIGGIITEVVQSALLWGVGINLKNSSQNYGSLDVEISLEALVEGVLEAILKKREWKEIFRIVDVEFHRSKKFYVNFDKTKKSLEKAILNSDGSICIDGVRKFSLR
jgi:BirA family biotin operon repressor/biotin-[acetyl-CoA-carboxylase] ligase